jgi:AmmeMemoRadiSam system protein A
MKPEELARTTVEKYIKERKILSDRPPKLFGVEVCQAGTFVSIKTSEGELRGCIGTIMPTRSSVIEEIIYNAISASTKDLRFPAVEPFELINLKYSVDILQKPEKISSFAHLNPEIYGIIVISDTGRQALLLPALEGLDTVEKQVSACMRKAGIGANEKVSIQRFKVDRYSEK